MENPTPIEVSAQFWLCTATWVCNQKVYDGKFAAVDIPTQSTLPSCDQNKSQYVCPHPTPTVIAGLITGPVVYDGIPDIYNNQYRVKFSMNFKVDSARNPTMLVLDRSVSTPTTNILPPPEFLTDKGIGSDFEQYVLKNARWVKPVGAGGSNNLFNWDPNTIWEVNVKSKDSLGQIKPSDLEIKSNDNAPRGTEDVDKCYTC